MKTLTFENPPLSFKPKILIIQQQENGWQFIIYADGRAIGALLYRTEYGAASTCDIVFTENDKDFLINATSIGFKNPQQGL